MNLPSIAEALDEADPRTRAGAGTRRSPRIDDLTWWRSQRRRLLAKLADYQNAAIPPPDKTVDAFVNVCAIIRRLERAAAS